MCEKSLYAILAPTADNPKHNTTYFFFDVATYKSETAIPKNIKAEPKSV